MCEGVMIIGSGREDFYRLVRELNRSIFGTWRIKSEPGGLQETKDEGKKTKTWHKTWDIIQLNAAKKRFKPTTAAPARPFSILVVIVPSSISIYSQPKKIYFNTRRPGDISQQPLHFIIFDGLGNPPLTDIRFGMIMGLEIFKLDGVDGVETIAGNPEVDTRFL